MTHDKAAKQTDGLRSPSQNLPICMQTCKMHALNSTLRDDVMAMLTVRNLPNEVHRALRVRASQHGRSTEAEVRDILSKAVQPEMRIHLGDALAALGRQIGLSNQDVDVLEQARTQVPAEPMRLD